MKYVYVLMIGLICFAFMMAKIMPEEVRLKESGDETWLK